MNDILIPVYRINIINYKLVYWSQNFKKKYKKGRKGCILGWNEREKQKAREIKEDHHNHEEVNEDIYYLHLQCTLWTNREELSSTCFCHT